MLSHSAWAATDGRAIYTPTNVATLNNILSNLSGAPYLEPDIMDLPVGTGTITLNGVTYANTTTGSFAGINLSRLNNGSRIVLTDGNHTLGSGNYYKSVAFNGTSSQYFLMPASSNSWSVYFANNVSFVNSTAGIFNDTNTNNGVTREIQVFSFSPPDDAVFAKNNGPIAPLRIVVSGSNSTSSYYFSNNVSFLHNNATSGNGGNIQITSNNTNSVVSIEVDNTLVMHNTTLGASARGAGIYAYSNGTNAKINLTLENANFSNMVATNGGGAIALYEDSATASANAAVINFSANNVQIHNSSTTGGNGGGLWGNIQTNGTINWLLGNVTTNNVSSASSGGVVFLSIQNGNQNFNITGNATFTNSSSTATGGGAMFIRPLQVSPTRSINLNLNNVTMINSSALGSYGGAVFIQINNSTVNWQSNSLSMINSSAADHGGAMYARTIMTGANVSTLNFTVSQNLNISNSTTTATSGGGIMLNVDKPGVINIELVNGVIFNNTAVRYGGGIAILGDNFVNAIFRNITFNNNKVTTTSFGGGLYVDSSQSVNKTFLLLENVTFNANNATDGGSGLYIITENALPGNILMNVTGTLNVSNHTTRPAMQFLHSGQILQMNAIGNMNFTNNNHTTTDPGGALSLLSLGATGTSGLLVNAANATFINSSAGGKGGAMGIYMTTNSSNYANVSFNGTVAFHNSMAATGGGHLFALTEVADTNWDLALSGSSNFVNGNAGTGNGGAMYLQGTTSSNHTILFNNMSMSINNASANGGAIAIDAFSSANTNMSMNITMGGVNNFSNNTATNGAAWSVVASNNHTIMLNGSTATNIAFNNNTANKTSAGLGGAIYTLTNSTGGSNVTYVLNNASFNNNTVFNSGGAIYSELGVANSRINKIFNGTTVFDNNKVLGAGTKVGGAIAVGTVTDVNNVSLNYTFNGATSFTNGGNASASTTLGGGIGMNIASTNSTYHMIFNGDATFNNLSATNGSGILINQSNKVNNINNVIFNGATVFSNNSGVNGSAIRAIVGGTNSRINVIANGTVSFINLTTALLSSAATSGVGINNFTFNNNTVFNNNSQSIIAFTSGSSGGFANNYVFNGNASFNNNSANANGGAIFVNTTVNGNNNTFVFNGTLNANNNTVTGATTNNGGFLCANTTAIASFNSFVFNNTVNITNGSAINQSAGIYSAATGSSSYNNYIFNGTVNVNNLVSENNGTFITTFTSGGSAIQNITFNNSLVITNSTVNNTVNGGMIYINSTGASAVHNLRILKDAQFINNTGESIVAYSTGTGATTNIEITNATFTNNGYGTHWGSAVNVYFNATSSIGNVVINNGIYTNNNASRGSVFAPRNRHVGSVLNFTLNGNHTLIDNKGDIAGDIYAVGTSESVINMNINGNLTVINSLATSGMAFATLDHRSNSSMNMTFNGVTAISNTVSNGNAGIMRIYGNDNNRNNTNLVFNGPFTLHNNTNLVNTMSTSSGGMITADGGVMATKGMNLIINGAFLANGSATNGRGGVLYWTDNGITNVIANGTVSLVNGISSGGSAIAEIIASNNRVVNLTFNNVLTIQNNQANNLGYNLGGGGIQIESIGAITNHLWNFTSTSDVYFLNNLANTSSGGAINVNLIAGAATNISIIHNMARAYFHNNTAGSTGGGIYLVNSDNHIVNFSSGQIFNMANNTATVGGGIYSYLASPAHTVYQFVNATFNNNTANAGSGGGVYLLSDYNVLLGNQLFNITGNATFTNNTATANGGGMTVQLFSMAMRTNVSMSGLVNFSNNNANNGGAIAVITDNQNSTFLLNQGTFNNNTATANGGAFYWVYSGTGNAQPTLQNYTTLTNNTAALGGGWYHEQTGGIDVGFTLNNLTASNNNATTLGGAMYITAGADSLANLTYTFNGNTILHANNGVDGAGIALVTTNSTKGTLNFVGPFNATNNNVSAEGGGLYLSVNNASNNTVNIQNTSLLANNTGNLGSVMYLGGPNSIATGGINNVTFTNVIAINNNTGKAVYLVTNQGGQNNYFNSVFNITFSNNTEGIASIVQKAGSNNNVTLNGNVTFNNHSVSGISATLNENSVNDYNIVGNLFLLNSSGAHVTLIANHTAGNNTVRMQNTSTIANNTNTVINMQHTAAGGNNTVNVTGASNWINNTRMLNISALHAGSKSEVFLNGVSGIHNSTTNGSAYIKMFANGSLSLSNVLLNSTTVNNNTFNNGAFAELKAATNGNVVLNVMGVFSNNTGVLFAYDMSDNNGVSQVFITNSSINNNPLGSSGSVLRFTGTGNNNIANITVTNSTVANNTGTGNGTGMLVNFTTGNNNITTNNWTFFNNTGTDGGGAALYFSGDSTGAVNLATVFNNNQANRGGAIYLHRSGTESVALNLPVAAVYSNNTATTSGGAMHILQEDTLGGAMIFNGTTFQNNTAASGAAIYAVSNSAGQKLYQMVGDIAISNNTATSAGTGVFLNSSHASGNNTLDWIGNLTATNNNAVGQSGGVIYTLTSGGDNYVLLKNVTNIYNSTAANNTFIGSISNSAGNRNIYTINGSLLVNNVTATAGGLIGVVSNNTGGGNNITFNVPVTFNANSGNVMLVRAQGTNDDNIVSFAGLNITNSSGGIEGVITGSSSINNVIFNAPINFVNTTGSLINVINNGSTGTNYFNINGAMSVVNGTDMRGINFDSFSGTGENIVNQTGNFLMANTTTGRGINSTLNGAGKNTGYFNNVTMHNLTSAIGIFLHHTNNATGNSSMVFAGNTSITNITSLGDGGAIHARPHRTVMNISFLGNAVFNNINGGAFLGGGVYFRAVNSTLNANFTNLTFNNNSAGEGAGIFIITTGATTTDYVSATVDNLNFVDQSASNIGGSIVVNSQRGGAIITANNLSIVNSIAHNAGGGVVILGTGHSSVTPQLYASNTLIANCISNTSSGGGVRISTNNGTSTILFANGTIVNNTAITNGGAISIDSGRVVNLTLNNILLNNNKATTSSFGGAIFLNSSRSSNRTRLDLINVTLNANNATNGGSGLYVITNPGNILVNVSGNLNIYNHTTRPAIQLLQTGHFLQLNVTNNITFIDNNHATTDPGGALSLLSVGATGMVGLFVDAANATFINSSAGGKGGAMGLYMTTNSSNYGNVAFNGTVAFHNSTAATGGGHVFMLTEVADTNWDFALSGSSNFTNGNAGTGNGGAMYLQGTTSSNHTILFNNMSMSINNASANGGAIAIDAFSSANTNMSMNITMGGVNNFSNNTATNGAAWSVVASNNHTIMWNGSTATSIAFNNNTANKSSAGLGGAIYTLTNSTGGSNVTYVLNNASFNNNTVFNSGGAIYSELGVTNSRINKIFNGTTVFDNNKVLGAGTKVGGAIAVATVTDVNNVSLNYTFNGATSFTNGGNASASTTLGGGIGMNISSTNSIYHLIFNGDATFNNLSATNGSGIWINQENKVNNTNNVVFNGTTLFANNTGTNGTAIRAAVGGSSSSINVVANANISFINLTKAILSTPVTSGVGINNFTFNGNTTFNNNNQSIDTNTTGGSSGMVNNYVFNGPTNFNNHSSSISGGAITAVAGAASTGNNFIFNGTVSVNNNSVSGSGIQGGFIYTVGSGISSYNNFTFNNALNISNTSSIDSFSGAIYSGLSGTSSYNQFIFNGLVTVENVSANRTGGFFSTYTNANGGIQNHSFTNGLIVTNSTANTTGDNGILMFNTTTTGSGAIINISMLKDVQFANNNATSVFLQTLNNNSASDLLIQNASVNNNIGNRGTAFDFYIFATNASGNVTAHNGIYQNNIGNIGSVFSARARGNNTTVNFTLSGNHSLTNNIGNTAGDIYSSALTNSIVHIKIDNLTSINATASNGPAFATLDHHDGDINLQVNGTLNISNSSSNSNSTIGSAAILRIYNGSTNRRNTNIIFNGPVTLHNNTHLPTAPTTVSGGMIGMFGGVQDNSGVNFIINNTFLANGSITTGRGAVFYWEDNGITNFTANGTVSLVNGISNIGGGAISSYIGRNNRMVNITFNNALNIENNRGDTLGGGGIQIASGASVTNHLWNFTSTSDVYFVNNLANTSSGGAMNLELTTGVTTNVLLKHNFTRLYMHNNTATNNGGGLYVRSGNRSIIQFNNNESVSLYNNTAVTGSGGAAYLQIDENSNISYQWVNFTANNNTATLGNGGALHLLNNGTIVGQQIFNTTGNSIISNNTAGQNGGGISISSINTTGHNVNFMGTITMHNNTALKGGALAVITQNATQIVLLENATFTNNTANEQGGAIYSELDTLSGMIVFNGSTVFDNNKVQGSGSKVGGAIAINTATDVDSVSTTYIFNGATSFTNGGNASASDTFGGAIGMNISSTNSTYNMAFEGPTTFNNLSATNGSGMWINQANKVNNTNNIEFNNTTVFANSTNNAIAAIVGGVGSGINVLGNAAMNFINLTKAISTSPITGGVGNNNFTFNYDVTFNDNNQAIDASTAGSGLGMRNNYLFNGNTNFNNNTVSGNGGSILANSSADNNANTFTFNGAVNISNAISTNGRGAGIYSVASGSGAYNDFIFNGVVNINNLTADNRGGFISTLTSGIGAVQNYTFNNDLLVANSTVSNSIGYGIVYVNSTADNAVHNLRMLGNTTFVNNTGAAVVAYSNGTGAVTNISINNATFSNNGHLDHFGAAVNIFVNSTSGIGNVVINNGTYSNNTAARGVFAPRSSGAGSILNVSLNGDHVLTNNSGNVAGDFYLEATTSRINMVVGNLTANNSSATSGAAFATLDHRSNSDMNINFNGALNISNSISNSTGGIIRIFSNDNTRNNTNIIFAAPVALHNNSNLPISPTTATGGMIAITNGVVVNSGLNLIINDTFVANSSVTSGRGGVLYWNDTGVTNLTANGTVSLVNGSSNGGGAIASHIASNNRVVNLTFNNTLTIENNQANQIGGGGIQIESGASVTNHLWNFTSASDVNFVNNSANGTSGGAIHIDLTTGLMNNVVVKHNFTRIAANDNTADNSGGAFYVQSGNASVLQFSSSESIGMHNNTAVTGSGGAGYLQIDGNSDISYQFVNLTANNNTAPLGSGGALYLLHNGTTVGQQIFNASGNTIISNNTAGQNGGGVSIFSVNTTGHDVSFAGNVIFHNNTAQNGGAVAMIAENATQLLFLDNATFTNNTATSKGGAIYWENSGMDDINANITSWQLQNNTAGVAGGAIAMIVNGSGQNNITVVDALTVENNQAPQGGFLYLNTSASNSAAILTFNNSASFINNTGGAIYAATAGANSTINLRFNDLVSFIDSPLSLYSNGTNSLSVLNFSAAADMVNAPISMQTVASASNNQGLANGNILLDNSNFSMLANASNSENSYQIDGVLSIVNGSKVNLAVTNVANAHTNFTINNMLANNQNAPFILLDSAGNTSSVSFASLGNITFANNTNGVAVMNALDNSSILVDLTNGSIRNNTGTVVTINPVGNNASIDLDFDNVELHHNPAEHVIYAPLNNTSSNIALRDGLLHHNTVNGTVISVLSNGTGSSNVSFVNTSLQSNVGDNIMLLQAAGNSHLNVSLSGDFDYNTGELFKLHQLDQGTISLNVTGDMFFDVNTHGVWHFVSAGEQPMVLNMLANMSWHDHAAVNGGVMLINSSNPVAVDNYYTFAGNQTFFHSTGNNGAVLYMQANQQGNNTVEFQGEFNSVISDALENGGLIYSATNQSKNKVIFANTTLIDQATAGVGAVIYALANGTNGANEFIWQENMAISNSNSYSATPIDGIFAMRSVGNSSHNDLSWQKNVSFTNVLGGISTITTGANSYNTVNINNIALINSTAFYSETNATNSHNTYIVHDANFSNSTVDLVAHGNNSNNNITIDNLTANNTTLIATAIDGNINYLNSDNILSAGGSITLNASANGVNEFVTSNSTNITNTNITLLADTSGHNDIAWQGVELANTSIVMNSSNSGSYNDMSFANHSRVLSASNISVVSTNGAAANLTFMNATTVDNSTMHISSMGGANNISINDTIEVLNSSLVNITASGGHNNVRFERNATVTNATIISKAMTTNSINNLTFVNSTELLSEGTVRVETHAINSINNLRFQGDVLASLNGNITAIVNGDDSMNNITIAAVGAFNNNNKSSIIMNTSAERGVNNLSFTQTANFVNNTVSPIKLSSSTVDSYNNIQFNAGLNTVNNTAERGAFIYSTGVQDSYNHFIFNSSANITDNNASEYGGAIYAAGVKTMITVYEGNEVRFYNNYADGELNDIYLDDATIDFDIYDNATVYVDGGIESSIPMPSGGSSVNFTSNNMVTKRGGGTLKLNVNNNFNSDLVVTGGVLDIGSTKQQLTGTNNSFFIENATLKFDLKPNDQGGSIDVLQNNIHFGQNVTLMPVLELTNENIQSGFKGVFEALAVNKDSPALISPIVVGNQALLKDINLSTSIENGDLIVSALYINNGVYTADFSALGFANSLNNIHNKLTKRTCGVRSYEKNTSYCKQARTQSTWAEIITYNGKHTGDSNMSGFKTSQRSVALGWDAVMENHLMLGYGYMYTAGNALQNKRGSESGAHSMFMYLAYENLHMNVKYSHLNLHNSYQDNRNGETVESQYGGKNFAANMEWYGKYNFIGMRYRHTAFNKYSDELQNEYDATNDSNTALVLGLHFNNDYFSMQGAWVYDIEPNRWTSKVRKKKFAGDFEEQTSSIKTPRYGAEFNMQGILLDSDEVEITTRYQGERKGKYSSHSGMINLRINM